MTTMASKIIIPRFLLPRRNILQQQHNLQRILLRHASTKPPSKPNILAKPEKFNPPSHGSKLRQPGGPKITNYGPDLTEAQKFEQTKKQYPNMMPPEGTFMHWFLHTKSIHAWISLSTLSLLALYAFYHSFVDDEEFMKKYHDLLPPLNSVFLHPIKFFSSLINVAKLRTTEKSAEARERRMRDLEDIDKRKVFRKEHGLESEGFWSGWRKEDLKGMPRESWHEEEDALKEKEEREMKEKEMEAKEVAAAEAVAIKEGQAKKWLGIW